MKRITGIAILTTAEGERITYTFSEIDENGNIIKSNEKRSFVVMDTETETILTQLKEKVNINLQLI